jgi:hypothetical protein
LFIDYILLTLLYNKNKNMKYIILLVTKSLFELIFTIFLVGLILGLPVMLLWNLVIPDIFNLKEISFLQAIELNLLSGFLIKVSSNSTKIEKSSK